ncbi:MAG: NUDIX hydrolase [Propionibacteriaceae bacterium]|nr:NUDIX hydrolase [Propionibacteriaceae bacterium]
MSPIEADDHGQPPNASQPGRDAQRLGVMETGGTSNPGQADLADRRSDDAISDQIELSDVAVQWPTHRESTTAGVLMEFVVDKVETPDGTTMIRNYLKHPNSVGVIALDEAGRVAIERQYRHPVRRKLVEAPAGLCDHDGEDMLQAAQRELAEELGFEASQWSILVDVFATPGCSTQGTRIFLAQGLTSVSRPEGFELEAEEADMAVGWADVDAVLDAIYAGRVMNPTLITGVLALKTAQLTGRVLRTI